MKKLETKFKDINRFYDQWIINDLYKMKYLLATQTQLKILENNRKFLKDYKNVDKNL